MRFLQRTYHRLAFLLSLAVAFYVFCKNAWVNDDAYIMFRSIEQLFAGNGPVWNPHERVQVFTSPLWYLVLSIARVFSQNVYLNALIVSAVLLALTLFVLRKVFANDTALLISVLLFSASNAFFDYTSSGLENVLAYLLLALYMLQYLSLCSGRKGDIPKLKRHVKFLLVVFGLLLCVRHDLVLIVLIPTFYAIVRYRALFTPRQWTVRTLLALSPFIVWTLFSVIYYGVPFPNTAYAKLNTGIPRADLLAQGFQYFITSAVHDPLTLLVIVAGLALSLFDRGRPYLRYLGLGIILDLMYIAFIGGDFMQGRFFSYAYMISAIVLLTWLVRLPSLGRRSFFLKMATATTLLVYLLFYPHTPLTAPASYDTFLIDHGIADERGIYFETMSLNTYLRRHRAHQFFPNHRWAHAGLKFRGARSPVAIQKSTGLFGYFAGTMKTIIDPYALSDPLLARLPVTAEWRIGHFERAIPEGYLQSRKTGYELIANPELNHFYHELRIVTQSHRLFTLERLKAIVALNSSAYDHLIQKK